MKGYCPSFVSVRGGQVRKVSATVAETDAQRFAMLPDPALPSLETPHNVLLAGIGGTGVVTVGAILSVAAHLEGKGCSELDVTGLAQKNGAVSSHVRIASTPDAIHASRIGTGAADLVLGCDVVVATNFEHLPKFSERTTAVLNRHVQPTAEFATNADLDLSSEAMEAVVREVCGEASTHALDATALATALMGDAVYTNMFLLGIAYQLGSVPVSLEALHRAIELNGRQAAANQRALAWGRLFVHDREALEEAAAPALRGRDAGAELATTLDGLVARRTAELTTYQSARLATRYRKLVDRVAAREREVAPGSDALARAVARYYFKVLAIKDEFEIARLYTDGRFEEQLAREFEGSPDLTLHLASDHVFGPWFAPRDPETGRAKKLALPARLVFPVFRVTARLKFLRGTPLNPFGWRAHRRLERSLIGEYERSVEGLLDGLSAENLDLSVEIATLPEQVRGFDTVKESHLAAAREKEAELREALRLR